MTKTHTDTILIRLWAAHELVRFELEGRIDSKEANCWRLLLEID